MIQVMSTKNIIEVKDLVKKYKKANTNAVDGISFEVKEGELFAFLGPNGAGKTTTISMLTTTLSKTSGSITIAGFDTEKESSKVRQNVGIIFQNPSLDLNLTAEENIRFHSVLYGLYTFRPSYQLMPKDYKKRVEQLSSVLGLGKEIFKPIKSFSGGMKRKLEIIRSLMHKPKVLFLDEPTVGLDPLSRKNLWEYLQEVRKTEKTTIFLTTHYLDEAEGADRICIINHGKIVSLGTPNKIKQELVKEYIEIDSEKNRKKLVEELIDKKMKVEGSGPFIVHLNDNEVHKILKSIDTPLDHIRIHTPTLEEAYLEIISEQNNNRKKEDVVNEGT